MFDVELRLHAVTEHVSADELRAYWNVKECARLDAVLLRSPSIVLGHMEVVYPVKRISARTGRPT